MSKSRIELLLVDDHPVVLAGLQACLAVHPRFKIVGEARDGDQAVRQVAALKPDIVLLDLSLPGKSGLLVAARVRQEKVRTRVIVLTVHDDREHLRRAVRAGVRGYLLKDAAPSALVRAIEVVHGGGTYFSPELVGDVLANSPCRGGGGRGALTPRELEVIALVAEGHTTKQVAQALKVSERTALTHRQNLMAKLRIHNVAGLTRYAVAQGVVPARPRGGP